MSESTQIVRQLRSGEFLPTYSTDELMRGVCHIVRDPFSTVVKESCPKPITAKARSHPRHKSTIKRMLADKRSDVAIATAIGITRADVCITISNDSGLRTLAVKRACHSKTDRCFGTIKSMILDGKLYREISAEIGMSQAAVECYIGKVDELTRAYRAQGAAAGRSLAKFEKNREAIIKELKTNSFTDVRTKYGFGAPSLRKYLEGCGYGK